jgi:hypothetical protein
LRKLILTALAAGALAESALAFTPTPGAYHDQLKSLEAQLFDVWWHKLAPSDRSELLADERAFERNYDRMTNPAAKVKAITDRIAFLSGISHEQTPAAARVERATPAPQTNDGYTVEYKGSDRPSATPERQTQQSPHLIPDPASYTDDTCIVHILGVSVSDQIFSGHNHLAAPEGSVFVAFHVKVHNSAHQGISFIPQNIFKLKVGEDLFDVQDFEKSFEDSDYEPYFSYIEPNLWRERNFYVEIPKRSAGQNMSLMANGEEISSLKPAL